MMEFLKNPIVLIGLIVLMLNGMLGTDWLAALLPMVG